VQPAGLLNPVTDVSFEIVLADASAALNPRVPAIQIVSARAVLVIIVFISVSMMLGCRSGQVWMLSTLRI
jgi:hypothetical protein